MGKEFLLDRLLLKAAADFLEQRLEDGFETVIARRTNPIVQIVLFSRLIKSRCGKTTIPPHFDLELTGDVAANPGDNPPKN